MLSDWFQGRLTRQARKTSFPAKGARARAGSGNSRRCVSPTHLPRVMVPERLRTATVGGEKMSRPEQQWGAHRQHVHCQAFPQWEPLALPMLCARTHCNVPSTTRSVPPPTWKLGAGLALLQAAGSLLYRLRGALDHLHFGRECFENFATSLHSLRTGRNLGPSPPQRRP